MPVGFKAYIPMWDCKAAPLFYKTGYIFRTNAFRFFIMLLHSKKTANFSHLATSGRSFFSIRLLGSVRQLEIAVSTSRP